MLLLADEPTAALDPTHALEVTALLLELAEELGFSTIIVSHDWDLMKSLGVREVRAAGALRCHEHHALRAPRCVAEPLGRGEHAASRAATAARERAVARALTVGRVAGPHRRMAGIGLPRLRAGGGPDAAADAVRPQVGDRDHMTERLKGDPRNLVISGHNAPGPPGSRRSRASRGRLRRPQDAVPLPRPSPRGRRTHAVGSRHDADGRGRSVRSRRRSRTAGERWC